MAMLQIELPDGSVKEVGPGSTPYDVALTIGEGLARQAVAARFEGELIDVTRPLFASGKLALITQNSPEALEIIRHSCAHLMAQAVKDLYGDEVQVTIGPAIKDGFYYDFYSETKKFVPEDFEGIEKKMAELAKADLPIEREDVSRDDAIKMFSDMGEEYKVELIKDLDEPQVSVYRQGNFVDLCRGPHIPRTGILKAYKLTLKKHASVTTANSAANLICSLLVKRLALGWLFGTRRGPCCAPLSRTLSGKSISSVVTISSWGRRSSRPSCGRPPVITRTTARICISLRLTSRVMA